jgi:hypothetical protein
MISAGEGCATGGGADGVSLPAIFIGCRPVGCKSE